MAHTPGPWQHKNLIVQDAKGGTIAHCTRWDGPRPKPEEAEANAKVISLTPDLVLSLRNLVDALPDCNDDFITDVNGKPMVTAPGIGLAVKHAREVLEKVK